MATLRISDIIDLIPDSKRVGGSGRTDSTQFNVAESVAQQLAEPLSYPMLDKAVLPEDTVCIALESGVPSGDAIVEEVVEQLMSIGVAPSAISILLGENFPAAGVDEFGELLSTNGWSEVSVVRHDSRDMATCGYLTSCVNGDPVRLNARLVHADFVIPIGVTKRVGWKNHADFFYPFLSDHDSIVRFFHRDTNARLEIINESKRWLGVTFAIQVVTDGESIHQVIAGETDVVENAAQESLKKMVQAHADQFESDQGYEADLVIAEIGPHQFVSREEAHDLINEVTRHCTDSGTCLVCWNDNREVTQFVDVESETSSADDSIVSEMASNEIEPDWIPSQQVFLSTEQSVMKNLEFSRIENREQVQRLIESHQRCLLLTGIQFTGCQVSNAADEINEA